MTELTCKQLNVYKFIKDYIDTNKIPPSIREVANGFSITDRSAHDYLKAIQRKGYIRIIPNTARGIVVIK